ncbi:MAG: hypothetical protein ABIG44_10945 [Planctomycetota bacterium]
MKQWCIALIITVIVGALPTFVMAGDSDPADMEIWSIRATTKNTVISPELKGLAEALKKQFKYTGFKLEKRSTGRSDLGKPFSADLLGGYKATVTPKSRSGKKITLQVVATKGGKNIISTTYTTDVGKLFPLGIGPLDGGDYLIIAVRAR